ncbi:MAG TPA: CBS domain-containing protein [Jatrophihabitans sp.]
MTGIDLAAPGVTVARAVVTAPKVLEGGASAADVRRVLADDHVHAALVVDGGGVLLAVVERDDLIDHADTSPARSLGRLAGRTVAAHASLREVAADMLARRRRRLAVVDEKGRLVGLLCMKRDFSGFCSDADVRARADDADRRAG